MKKIILITVIATLTACYAQEGDNWAGPIVEPPYPPCSWEPSQPQPLPQVTAGFDAFHSTYPPDDALMIYPMNSITMILRWEKPLPPNLAIAPNFLNPLVDECDPVDEIYNYSGNHQMKISEDRKSAEVKFEMGPGSDLYNNYFGPDGLPNSDIISFRLYKRKSCNDDLTLYRSFESYEIIWSEKYAQYYCTWTSTFEGFTFVTSKD